MRPTAPAIPVLDLPYDRRSSRDHRRDVSFALLVDLSTCFLTDDGREVITPANVVDPLAKGDSTAFKENTLRSEGLDMGSSEAAVLAVKDAISLRLGHKGWGGEFCHSGGMLSFVSMAAM